MDTADAGLTAAAHVASDKYAGIGRYTVAASLPTRSSVAELLAWKAVSCGGAGHSMASTEVQRKVTGLALSVALAAAADAVHAICALALVAYLAAFTVCGLRDTGSVLAMISRGTMGVV